MFLQTTINFFVAFCDTIHKDIAAIIGYILATIFGLPLAT